MNYPGLGINHKTSFVPDDILGGICNWLGTCQWNNYFMNCKLTRSKFIQCWQSQHLPEGILIRMVCDKVTTQKWFGQKTWFTMNRHHSHMLAIIQRIWLFHNPTYWYVFWEISLIPKMGGLTRFILSVALSGMTLSIWASETRIETNEITSRLSALRVKKSIITFVHLLNNQHEGRVIIFIAVFCFSTQCYIPGLC